MPAFVLTEAQIKLLQEVVNKSETTRVNIPPRPMMERSFAEAEDHQAPEVYIAKPQTSAGIPGLLTTEPGVADCDIYQILIDDVSGDPELSQIPEFNVTVYNISSSDLDQDWMLVTRTKYGKYVAVSGSGNKITELMLAEDHPGRGIVFKAFEGTWCSTTHEWLYTCSDACADWVWCIDWRNGVPEPEIGARGLFTPRVSTIHGTIYEALEIDCVSPGTCDEQGYELPCVGTGTTNYPGVCDT